MKTVSDIMVADVLSVYDTDSLYQARMLIKDKGIRHIPVLDSKTDEFIGVLTQRKLLNHVFNTVEKFGLSGLEKREQRIQVSEIMDTQCETAAPDMDFPLVSHS